MDTRKWWTILKVEVMGDGHATGEMDTEDKALSLEHGSKVVVWIKTYHSISSQTSNNYSNFFFFFAFWSDNKIFGVV